MNIIYALVDPRTEEIRYVGKSTKGLVRPQAHWKSTAHRERNDHCHAWVRSLLREGLLPQIQVLEEPTAEELGDAETRWIKKLRESGVNLTNMTDGGDGVPKGTIPWNKGKKNCFSSDVCQTISQKARQRNYGTYSEERKRAISEAIKKHWLKRKGVSTDGR